MKKEDVASLVIYVLMIVISIVVGLTVVQNELNKASINSPFAVVLLILAVALIFNVVMLEVLHAIGAKLGGYSVVSINILYFCFEKKLGKWSFHFKDFDGLTGETKIAPKKEKLSLKPYIWLPLFGYAIEFATCLVLYSSVSKEASMNGNDWLAVASILTILISSLIALYNLVPLKLDAMTDGYRMVLLSKPVNIEAYNELLRAQDQERNGEKVKELKVYSEITEFTANINLLSTYRALDEGDYKKAEEILDIIMADPTKIDPATNNKVIAQKLFIEIMSKDIAEAKESYEKFTNDEYRRFLANDGSIECVRTYLLVAGLIDESESEVKYTMGKLDKAKKHIMPSRLEVEEKLLKLTIDKVYGAHPEWKKDAE